MAVKVTGDKIELFLGEQVDVLAGEMPPKVGDATDSAHTKGTAGIHMGSNPANFDNIVVFGPGGPTPVEPQGKLATAWGQIKSSD